MSDSALRNTNIDAALNDAKEEYVTRNERRIVLIDGRRLAQLMIEHDVGVATSRAYVVKKLIPHRVQTY